MDTIGQRIKQRREDLDMSQDELAKKMGWSSRNSVWKYEQCDDIKLNVIAKFAKALDCDPAYLMGWVTLDGTEIETNYKREEVNSANLIAYLDKFTATRKKEFATLIESYQAMDEPHRAQLMNYAEFLRKQCEEDQQ